MFGRISNERTPSKLILGVSHSMKEDSMLIASVVADSGNSPKGAPSIAYG